jgi:hypothetical protein
MSRLQELKQKKEALMSSENPKDSKKTRRNIERGMDDVISFKGLRRRSKRISTSQSFWNREYQKSKLN